MFRSKRFIKNAVLIIQIFILILICPSPVQTSAEVDYVNSADYEVPIYKIPIPENTQREIWKLCEKNNLSYELVLAIFQIDDDYVLIDDVNVAIKELVYYRDYWTEQGYSDEMVFNLMLLSKQKGVEGSKIFLSNGGSSDNDYYVQKVTAYKYYLDQIEGG